MSNESEQDVVRFAKLELVTAAGIFPVRSFQKTAGSQATEPQRAMADGALGTVENWLEPHLEEPNKPAYDD